MKKIIDFVSNQLGNDNTGHGLQHALRVYNNAKKINCVEKGDEKIVLTASLIHDTIDKKLFKNTTEQINLVRQTLIENNYAQSEIDEIVYIITNISWNNGKNNELNSLNAKIVRDADRLDALGAMGIIRTIEYGNSHHQPFYDENNIKTINNHFTFNQITKSSLSHFYEKLLLLKDNLHTDTARKMAETRHKFLLSFLQQFYDEL